MGYRDATRLSHMGEGAQVRAMNRCHTRAIESESQRRAVLAVAAVALSAIVAPLRAGAGLVLDDPLQGSTTGARSGGVFVAGGWKVTGAYDCIHWHVPTITEGAVEWEVRGLRPGECRGGMEDKTEIFHMYDHEFGDSDVNYNGGYRENPYKHFVRKIGCAGGAVDAMELVWKIGDGFTEPDTQVLSWDPAVTYRFREEWGPDGGSSRLRTYRNGVLVMTMTLPGFYDPAGLSIRIGASTRRDAAAGAPIDAVFSNVRVWDISEDAPAAPIIEEVSPDPDFAAPGLEYTRQLVLERGNPPPSWRILAGPPGLRIDASGRLRGWIPAVSDRGRRSVIEVRASNSQGSDAESWSVEVAEARAFTFPFDGDAEGWTLSGWKAGPYNPGTIAWEPSGGHPGGCIRAGGCGASNNLDTCTREGGIMTRAISTEGLRSLRLEYEVTSSLGAAPGASGVGNCPVLEGSSEDELVLYYSTRGANGPWNLAEVIPESEIPRTWVRRMVDLSGIPAAGDNPRFALRFQWQFNSQDDAGRIDNVRIQGAVIRIDGAFERGDANARGTIDIADAIFTLSFLLAQGTPPSCLDAADANDSGVVDIADAIALLSHLFAGAGPLPMPFDGCGDDPTADGLRCDGYAPCE